MSPLSPIHFALRPVGSLGCVALCLPLVTGCGTPPLVALEPLKRVAAPAAITLHVTGYCPAPHDSYKQLYAANLSALLRKGELLIDFDRDGVPDTDEATAKLDASSPDTSGQGFGDLASFLTGSARIGVPCDNPGIDSNGDGLDDCARRALSLSRDTFSTVGDGIPDFLKLRAGLDATNPVAGTQNPMGDGISNGDKIRMNIPLLEKATPEVLAYALAYEVSPGKDTGCFDFTVSNIPLAASPNGNLVRIYIVEQTPSAGWKLQSRVVEVPPSTAGGTRLTYRYEEMEKP